MKDKDSIRKCKTRKCQKILPAGYKYKYCEACRIQHAQTVKKVFKGVGAGAATVAGFALVMVSGGKIDLRK